MYTLNQLLQDKKKLSKHVLCKNNKCYHENEDFKSQDL